MARGDIFTLEQLQSLTTDTKQTLPSATSSFQKTADDSGFKDTPLYEPAEPVSFESKPTSFLGKARDFATAIIGGGKLAEGAGMALAAPVLQRKLSEVEQSMSNTDLELVKRIQEKAQAGEDTSRLIAAREQLLADMKDTRGVQKDFVESLPSNKEVIGSAVRLGATLATGALAKGTTAGSVSPSLPGLSSVAAKFTPAPTGFLTGLMRGGATGALTGAVEGGIQGAGIAAEQDKSTEQILYGAALGTAGGAITGGILGGAFGGWSGYKVGQTTKLQNFADDLTSPKLSPKERARAIAQGRLEDSTLFSRANIAADEFDKKVADSVRDIVDPKNPIGQNIDDILKKVEDTNTGVVQYVTKNKVPFNKAQLKTQLMAGKEDLKLVFASDATAEKTYDKAVEALMDELKSGDTAGLLKARQNFDQLPAVKKLLETDALGENARKEIILAVRGAANKYAADLLPAGNTFRSDLMKEHLMLEAIRNISEKSATIIGKNNLQLLFNRHPILYSLGSGLVGATGVGLVVGN